MGNSNFKLLLVSSQGLYDNTVNFLSKADTIGPKIGVHFSEYRFIDIDLNRTAHLVQNQVSTLESCRCVESSLYPNMW